MISIAAGCCAGILAVESWRGIVVYALANVLFSGVQLAAFKFDSSPYFDTPLQFWSEGIASGLLVAAAPKASSVVRRRSFVDRSSFVVCRLVVFLRLVVVRRLSQSFILFWALLFNIIHVY